MKELYTVNMRLMEAQGAQAGGDPPTSALAEIVVTAD